MSKPALEPHTAQFIDSLKGGKPLETLSPADARDFLSGAQSSIQYNIPAAVEETTFPVGPTGKVLVKIVRPEGASGTLTPIIYIHGGGWILGDRHVFDRHIRSLAIGANAAVFFVEYDRSPESTFPVAPEQGYAVLEYVAKNASSLKVNASKLVVAGDSVGGNMTAALCMLAKERSGPTIALQVMFYPAVDSRMNTASYQLYQDGPYLTHGMMKWFWDAYATDDQQKSNHIASPSFATTEQLRGLPTALIMTAENDVLRDEGEEFGRQLAKAGVRVTSTRYLGTIHDFVLLNAISDTPAARGAVAQACQHIRAL
jgi:acetyl esterase